MGLQRRAGPKDERTQTRRPCESISITAIPACRIASLPARTRFLSSSPRLIKLNVALAEQLGLDPEALASPEGVAVLAGNAVAEGSAPIAMAYAGHQFGHFVPQLGDGRANLLGEVIDRNGVRRDIQLKGSGKDTILARRRRPCGGRTGRAGVYRQRGDGGAGHPDNPVPGGGSEW